MAIVASWKFPGLFNGADANKVANEIRTIGEDVKAEQIVDFARDENSELHKCFEWNDSVAAEKYRITQAGRVVRHLVITKIRDEEEEKKSPPIRMFVKAERTKGYQPIERVVKAPDAYNSLIARARSEMIAFRNKYSNLVEIESVISAIDEYLG